ncbi:hypothetical protein EC9_29680 [Rosistilla ulvae]|uniref:Uncharacterized protein n=1 Tax=Rosistilla ulvae TaxID=1930277 RepID=A0A517M1L8_9BACT|nr:hypothetical protein [Rosistilla ulvae]QDS88773.1 hypothetical protein EC9_29680 [Rosistilla ulvae]
MPLFDRFDEIVDCWLNMDDTWDGTASRYRSMTSLLRLCDQNEGIGDGGKLLRKLYARLETNWDGEPSRGAENWRHTQNLDLGDNPSLEVSLQRRYMQSVNDNRWANEVPVASGVAGTGPDSVDFVHRSDATYSMIELKWPRPDGASETPLKAAIQVLRYGLAYIFSRDNAETLSYNPEIKPILGASQVHLRVLAPKHFYKRFLAPNCWLERFEKVLDMGIRNLAGETVKMSFAFEQFPERFSWNPEDCSDDAGRRAVVNAFQNRNRLFSEA